MSEKVKKVFDRFLALTKQKKKISLILVGVILLVFLVSGLLVGNRYRQIEAERERLANMGDMLVWYTNDSLTEYLEYVAKDYEKETGMHVVPKKVSPVDYIEAIYAASVSEQVTTPDVFITTHDVLEQAALSGVATDQYLSVLTEDFPQTAIDAVTYKEKCVGYPFYFETSVLLYNKNYIKEVPNTMDGILTLSESFETPEGMENILKWDCSNGFRNYFFGGAYVDIAGVHGDDADTLNLNNPELVKSLQYFQSMNDFFSIDIETVTEEGLIEEFVKGKTLLCFGDTSWFSRLEEQGMTNYGVAMLPALQADLKSKGIAITNVAVVNGFSNKQEEASRFAKAMTTDYAEDLYEFSGKVPAALSAEESHEGCKIAKEQYATCAQLPKLMNMGDFWVQFEITLDDIWKGNDVTATLNALETKTKQQMQ